MRRTRLLAGVAGAAALVVAALTGWYPYAALTPGPPVATLSTGGEAVVDGVRYRLERFTVAASLPADDADDPPATGPDGALLVLVVATQTVIDPAVDVENLYCDTDLVDDAGTTWTVDSDYTTLITRPAAYGCGTSEDAPETLGVPREMGFSFVVPASAAGRLTARMHLTHGPTVAFRP